MSCPLWSDGANAGRSDGSVDKKQVVVMRVTPSDSAEPAAPAETETTPIYQDVAAAVRGAAAPNTDHACGDEPAGCSATAPAPCREPVALFACIACRTAASRAAGSGWAMGRSHK